MAQITGSTTIDWSSVELESIDVSQNLAEFAERFNDTVLEIVLGEFVLNAPNTSAFLSITTSSGAIVTITGTGLDLANPAANPIIKTFEYFNPSTSEVVRLTGTIDFVGNEVVNSLMIGFSGSQETIIGNILVDPNGNVSGSIMQLHETIGSTEVTLSGNLVLSGNVISGTVTSGTVTQIKVLSGSDTIEMSGLSVPFSTLDSVMTANDLFTVVGSQMTGNDTITYTNNSGAGMTFSGGAGNDTITISGPNADTLNGGAGNDKLDGGAGNDAMDGGAGNDTYVVDSLGDTVTETLVGAAGGVDLVQSAAASFTLGANVENLTLTGTNNIDGTGNVLANILTGNSGNNTLSGLAGADKLIGGLGNDTLDGGGGVDKLAGGAAMIPTVWIWSRWARAQRRRSSWKTRSPRALSRERTRCSCAGSWATWRRRRR